METITQSKNFLYFVENFLLRNTPCLLDESFTSFWKSRKFWQQNGQPDLIYLDSEFGDANVPVADCSSIQFSSHTKTTWKISDYLSYWRKLQNFEKDGRESLQEKRLLYLKDWHFTRDYPSYNAYTIPIMFQSDWLNEVWDQHVDIEDDYRFVYMGPKGTWTPFHADVFRSYSWSTNICGQKEWLLFPPGDEENLRDKLGNLPLDVTSQELRDIQKYPNAHKVRGPIRVIQNDGETIFIPSGWYHQVKNLKDTISINHNWTNAFGIKYMWNHLKSELILVEKEIYDCKDMDGWKDQCQLILKCSAGMDFADFHKFLMTIALPRLKQLEEIIHSTEIQGIYELPDLLISVLRSVQRTLDDIAGLKETSDIASLQQTPDAVGLKDTSIDAEESSDDTAGLKDRTSLKEISDTECLQQTLHNTASLKQTPDISVLGIVQERGHSSEQDKNEIYKNALDFLVPSLPPDIQISLNSDYKWTHFMRTIVIFRIYEIHTVYEILQDLHEYIVYTDNESCTIGGGSDFKKEILRIIHEQ